MLDVCESSRLASINRGPLAKAMEFGPLADAEMRQIGQLLTEQPLQLLAIGSRHVSHGISTQSSLSHIRCYCKQQRDEERIAWATTRNTITLTRIITAIIRTIITSSIRIRMHTTITISIITRIITGIIIITRTDITTTTGIRTDTTSSTTVSRGNERAEQAIDCPEIETATAMDENKSPEPSPFYFFAEAFVTSC
jgi:hypothetical protein